MRIRCPYCDCRYDIYPDTLGNPVGHERLGFGWWLRCYQCQKKFWLKNTTVISTGFSPVRADNSNTIRRLSKFSNRKNKNKKHKYVTYIILLLLIIAGSVCYTHINDINNFFANRMKRFITSATLNLQLSDITYRIDKINGLHRIAVMGNIVNNTTSMMSYNGVRIVLLNNETEFASWTYAPDVKSIIPGDKVVFNTDRLLETIPDSVKVLVRIV